MNVLALFIALLTAMPSSGLPVRLSADRHYLVDSAGIPFLIHGDTAWSLLVQLNEADAERYLENRARVGYNAIIVNLIEHKFADNPPNTIDGIAPFLTPGNFSTPNEQYFSRADRVLRMAEQRGILVFLFPCYFGVNGGDEGFWKELNENGSAKCRQYGRYLGQRYRNYTNIIWVHGGDYTPPEDAPGVSYAMEILHGIREQDPGKLHSYHGVRSTVSLQHAKFAPFLQLNAVYTGDDLGRRGTPDEPYSMSLKEYFRPQPLPNYLIEARYEDLTGSTYGGTYTADRGRLRRQAYWAVLGGCSGHFFGNHPVWPFRPGWDGPDGIGSPANQDMGRLRSVFVPRSWHTLVPDAKHETLTAGYGTFKQTDYVTAARSADGNFVMAYVPPGNPASRTLTINMSRMRGTAAAQWFNPATGSYVAIPGSPFTNSGSRGFVTPGDNGTGTNDWILILEAK